MGRKMKNPVRRHLVLPLAGLEEVARHSHCPDLTHVLGGRHRSRKSEHLMTMGHQELDQFDTNESAGARNE